MKCAVVTPVGPGHEELYEVCRTTVEQAWSRGLGPFDQVVLLPMWDLEGRYGAASRRNAGVREAQAQGCDWVFFLDADDVMAASAFVDFEKHHAGHDAVWGMIIENTLGTETVAALQPQLAPTASLADVLAADPSQSLGMSHFVRTACAAQVGFDETLSAGDEFKHHLEIWRRFGAVKAPEVFVITRQGAPAGGPRAVDPRQRRLAVQKLLREAEARSQGAEEVEDWGVRAPRVASTRMFQEFGAGPAGDVDGVAIGGCSFAVQRHWFWPQFADAWEEETWRFYQRFADPRRTVLDVGSWIGPTMLFAAASGVRDIVAVEANPRTLAHLESTRAYNPELLGGVRTVNAVVAREAGMRRFGNLDGSEATSSASSTRGSGFEVRGETLSQLWSECGLVDPCLVKIDIEGSELEIADQLEPIKSLRDTAVLLSLHPPFWPAEAGRETHIRTMLAALDGFRCWTANGEPLGADELAGMMRHDAEAPPPWGTPYGNFFEVGLTTR